MLAGVAGDDSLATPPPGDSAVHQSVRQYTLGGTASARQGDRWTHTAVIGVDGYSLNDASAFGTPFTSAADSALRAARGSAMRGTARLSSVAQLGAWNRLAGAVTLALEHSAVREANRLSTTFGPESPPGEYGVTERTTRSRSNTGLIGQVNGSFRDIAFLSGGVRFEHSAGTTDVDRNATLPMFGAAFVQDFGRAAVKFRLAYGKGIRPAETTSPRARRGWESVGPRGRRVSRQRSSRAWRPAWIFWSAGRSASTSRGSISSRRGSSSRSR